MILSLLRPVGTAARVRDTGGEPIHSRQSFLYVWDKTASSALTWREAYRRGRGTKKALCL